MKWILVILILAPVGYSQTAHYSPPLESRNYNSESTNQVYYNQPANNYYQYQSTPNAYHSYNGYGNYPSFEQKQDFGLDTGGEDVVEAIAGTVAALAATVGLKVLKKLGLAAVFLFIFVIVPLLILPVVLAIASIIVSSVNSAGSQAQDIMDKLRQQFGKSRSLSIFQNYLLNEQCIERMFCTIGKRAYERSFIFSRIREQDSSPITTEEEESIEKPPESKNSTFFSRVSRAFRSEDCQAYKCSLTSYFY